MDGEGQICNNNNTHKTATFQGNPDKPVAACHCSGFYWSKDDGYDVDNWTYKM